MSSAAIGFICCGISVICWGSNFIPVKQYDTGDGMFFQWVMCAGIWITSVIVQLIRGADFHALAMLGGVIWCTGNVVCVSVILMIGMGLGILLWGSSNLVMGWASGHFGLFGIDQQTASHPDMNVAGFFVCLLSIAISFFIKTSQPHENEDSSSKSGSKFHERLLHEDEMTPPVADDLNNNNNNNGGVSIPNNNLKSVNSNERIDVENQAAAKQPSFIDRMSDSHRRVVGCALAVGCGAMFGVNFLPCQYIIDHKQGSDQGIDYVFSHFSGIFLSSTVYFLIYVIYKKNRPVLNNQLILPSFVSGLMWGVAQICFFTANTDLALVIVTPIVSTGPGILGTIWGCFLFKEVRGTKNFILMAAAFSTVLLGVGLIATSK